ncbi:MAG TPA: membrane protein insertase YidC [Treponemataceae bacterium]|nr:membrane protein insertase YidC [Treponemataceae bacterium]
MNVLYQITIFPVVTLIEVIYRAIESFLRNTGFSIIGVSLTVNLLCLPLYAVAECFQCEEREAQRKMKRGIDNIKAVFKGDERYMMLSTFYRQNHYHPAYALRSTFGLLIQIPFFIAAYKVLTTLPDLLGRSFWFISDLGSPDAMLKIASISINVLPLIMTAINVAASAVYTKGFSVKEKAQLYVVAALFCVLLYNSPSGLVFYWTLNNVFSLVKNILFKSRHAGKIAYVSLTAVIGLAVLGVFLRDTSTRQRTFALLILSLVALAPLIVKSLSIALRVVGKRLAEAPRKTTGIFIVSMIACALLIGLVIPSSLIASSVREFSYTAQYANPLSLLLSVFCCSLGCFVFWPLCVFFLFGKKTRDAFAVFALLALAIFSINAFVFQGSYGTLSPSLFFDDPGALKAAVAPFHLDIIAVVLAASLVIFLLHKTGTKIALPAVTLVAVSFFVLSTVQAHAIAREFSSIRKTHESEYAVGSKPSSVYSFTKNGRNVLFIMIDRAIGPFVGDIFKDDPKLNESMSGFTWYSNTFSFGGHTIMGAPALFGGYEYTPEKINARANETLVKKLDESCTVLPRLFAENGWAVTVTDMPFGDYAPYKSIKAYALNGKYQDDWLIENGMGDFLNKVKHSTSMNRKMLFFGFFKISPAFLRWTIYDMGGYWEMDSDTQSRYEYLYSYAALERIARLSRFDAAENSFTIIESDVTHNQTFLQYPDYAFVPKITDLGTNAFQSSVTWQLYHVNSAAFHSLGRLMEALKAAGVYDNTRIVIASDHGFKNIIYKDQTRYPSYFKDESIKPSYFSPVLMVKDFGASGPMREDRSFMSNADVPTILSAGVIANAVNPFSGIALSASVDKKKPRLSEQHAGRLVDHNANTFRIGDDEWITVHDSIFDESNWKWEKAR